MIVLSFILILAALAVYGVLHSLLASLRLKAWVRQRLGERFMRFYRLGYVLFVTVSLLPILALVFLLPDFRLYTIPFPWVLFTLGLQAAAGIALLLGVLQTDALAFLGLRQVLGSYTGKPQRLVTTGLYRWVRHPLYTAGLVLVWLMPLMTTNLLVFNLGITVYILIGMIFEERKLIAEFGAEYQAYRRRTPALFPLRRPR